MSFNVDAILQRQIGGKAVKTRYVIEVFSGLHITTITFYRLLNHLLEVHPFHARVGHFDMCLSLPVVAECVGIYVSTGEITSQ